MKAEIKQIKTVNVEVIMENGKKEKVRKLEVKLLLDREDFMDAIAYDTCDTMELLRPDEWAKICLDLDK